MRAVAETWRRYRQEPAAIRLHTALRALSCPFGKLVVELSPEARALDYGCGHGLFSGLLASRVRARVTGVDLDQRKIAVASRVLPESCVFQVIAPGAVPPGPWDAITVIDVLYLMAKADQLALLSALAAQLAPDGLLLVKEMHLDSRAKLAWLRLQERVMINLSATEGGQPSFTDPSEFASTLADSGLSVSSSRIDRGYPYPHHLIVARRNGP